MPDQKTNKAKENFWTTLKNTRLGQALVGDGGLTDCFHVLSWLIQCPDQAFLRLARRIRRRQACRITGRDVRRLHRLFQLILWTRPSLKPETVTRGILTLPEGYCLLNGGLLFWMALEARSLSDLQISLLYQHSERSPFERVARIDTVGEMRRFLDNMDNSLPLVAVLADKMARSSSWRRSLRVEDIQNWLAKFWNALHGPEQHVVECVWDQEGGFWLREFLLRNAHNLKRRQRKLGEIFQKDAHYAIEILEDLGPGERQKLLGPTFQPIMRELLASPDPEVREATIRLAGYLEPSNAWGATANAV